MPAVCAAMPVPFLEFRNPSVPQDVRARGWLVAETTWICVLRRWGGAGEIKWAVQGLQGALAYALASPAEKGNMAPTLSLAGEWLLNSSSRCQEGSGSPPEPH